MYAGNSSLPIRLEEYAMKSFYAILIILTLGIPIGHAYNIDGKWLFFLKQ